jgi:hypothetical protein
MNDYVNLYNNSMSEFIDIFAKKYNLDIKKVKDDYKYVHKKRMTGYMLFVKDMYQQKNIDTDIKFTNNSKIISQKWKTIDKETKKKYNDKAKDMNNSCKKIKDEENKKDENKNKKIKVQYNDKLDDIYLNEVDYDGKQYIIDNFGNIIDIVDNIGTYIGYVKDNNIFLYKNV